LHMQMMRIVGPVTTVFSSSYGLLKELLDFPIFLFYSTLLYS
jgi:hypothetical protein